MSKPNHQNYQAINSSPCETSALIKACKGVYGTISHGDELKLPADLSLYEALDQRRLLVRPSWPTGLGINLIADGELGLALFNGVPRFLAPGRHTLWSPVDHLVRKVKISEKLIELGNFQIVTVNQGELGLCRCNGESVLLNPGRYILKAPYRFENCTPANAQFIELGTYHRITVPAGYVALAYDNGKQIIIRPEDTAEGPFETSSPSFRFDARTGFKSVQLQVSELDELKVNTRDGITITARGLISYQIHDPRVAFMAVQDIHGAVKRGAEACLTSLFLNASIDEIAPSLPSHPKNQPNPRLAANVEPITALPRLEIESERADFSRHVRECFLHDFSKQVHEWGIELKNLNIEKLEFDQNVKDLLRKRAQSRLETNTNLTNMYAQTEVAMQEADRERRQKQVRAEADAVALRTRADAEYYAAERRAAAAKLLSENSLATQLELKRVDVEIVRAAGDKTTFLPLGMQIGEMALANKAGAGWMTATRDQIPQRA